MMAGLHLHLLGHGHDLTWSRAFEISVSSTHHAGLLRAHGNGPHRIGLRRGDDRAGPGRPPHQLPAHHLLGLQRSREGHEPPPPRSPGRRLTPRNSCRPCTAWAASRAPRSGRTAADWMLDLEQTHTAFPILTYFPGSDAEQSWVATVGAVLDASALVVAASDMDFGRGLRRRREGPADRARLRPPADRPDCHRRLHPVAPADAAPRPHGRVPASPPRRYQHQPGRVRHRPRGPVGDPRRPGRAARRRRGAASPGSDPPTTPRCGHWPGSPWPHGRHGRPTVRRRSAALASFADARCTSTGPTSLQMAEAA